MALIFKVNDDIRQDTLALQVIQLFANIFSKYDLDLFVYPYKTIANRTGENDTIGGVIEVVPNCSSRHQLGKEFASRLLKFFRGKFGAESSNSFKLARSNFIRSLASYGVFCYILNIKDRHNGNIMITDEGHIIHIDYGFIFSISPAGDMNFEKAAFKLTKEMVEILGGDVRAEAYQLLVHLTVKCFLAVR